MGQFRVEVTAVGAHGCDRTATAGEMLFGRCQRMGCPDCEAAAFVKRLRESGCSVESAKFTHWPDSPQEVVDDLLNDKRALGRFGA